MIQEFSVQNFLSFNEKRTISFLATSDKTLAEELIIEPKPGIRLLRMVMIYGANASGKSNLLNAIQAMWGLLFHPRAEEHEEVRFYSPFELSKGKPTVLEIVFWAKDRRYQYKIEYDNYSILYEKLMYSSDNDVLSLLYEREKANSVKFGSTLGIKAKQRDDLNRETLANHTVLSTLNKRNIEVPAPMRDLYEWVKKNVHELDVYNNAIKIAEQAESNSAIKKLILELLNKADFNISDFSTIEVKPTEDLIREIEKIDGLSDSARKSLLQYRKEILLTHKAGDVHFQIGFGLESSGTKTYFRLARVLFDLKKNGFVIMEDELEDSLHYDLLVHYLQTFLQSGSQSQLIFATHNQLLLDEDWMIRRDMVWFVEKDRRSLSSLLYRASDMGIHKNVSLMNAYRIGKLGAKPLLGTTFLAIEE